MVGCSVRYEVRLKGCEMEQAQCDRCGMILMRTRDVAEIKACSPPRYICWDCHQLIKQKETDYADANAETKRRQD